MIDLRIAEGVEELRTATAALEPMRNPSLPQAGLAVATAAFVGVLLVGGLALLVGSIGASDRFPTPSVSDNSALSAVPAEETTRSTDSPDASILHVGQLSLADAAWRVADSAAVQRDGLDRFELLSLGGPSDAEILEYQPLGPVEEIRDWYTVTLPEVGGPIEAVGVGEIFGYVVVKASRGESSSVCAWSPDDGSGVCSTLVMGVESETRSLGDTSEFEPAVWQVPSGTAIVRLENHDSLQWMVPVEGVVAFPWWFPHRLAEMTAFGQDGSVLAERDLSPVTAVGADGGGLPGPIDVDVLRVLTQQGLSIVAVGSDTGHPELPSPAFGRASETVLVLSGGSTALAILVGDGADRGFAVVSFGEGDRALMAARAIEAVALAQTESGETFGFGQGDGDPTVVQSSDLLLIVRNVDLETVVEYVELLADG